MTGIIDVGGGLRGIYGAGVFDRCMTDGIRFDYVIGVSAGAANGAAYCAGQKGRNYLFYTEYALRREYMGLETLRETGSFIGLDYIYSDLSAYQTLREGVTESDVEIRLADMQSHTLAITALCVTIASILAFVL